MINNFFNLLKLRKNCFFLFNFPVELFNSLKLLLFTDSRSSTAQHSEENNIRQTNPNNSTQCQSESSSESLEPGLN